MDVISRYASQSTFTDERGNTYSSRYRRSATSYSYITIVTKQEYTLDYLAFNYYGTPILYWLIADANGYIDPTITIPIGTTLKIPQL